MSSAERHLAIVRDAVARRRDRFRAIAWAAKAVPCMDCGEQYPHYVMEFDHPPGVTKVENVSRLITKNASVDRLLAEIAKCEVVCSNCHRERTFGGSR